MIYLRESNILFIKPYKVAGTSFEIALSKFAKDGDIITPITEEDEGTRKRLGYRSPQNHLKRIDEYELIDFYRFFRKRTPALKYFNHISAEKLRDTLGAEIFYGCKKVSIVRNPFDRIISQYHWSMKNHNGEEPEFVEWIRCHPLFLRQNYGHYFVDGQYIIDRIIRYENLIEDCLSIESEVPVLKGLSEDLSRIKAKGGVRSAGRDLREYYSKSDDLASSINFYNREIIDKFGYTLS